MDSFQMELSYRFHRNKHKQVNLWRETFLGLSWKKRKCEKKMCTDTSLTCRPKISWHVLYTEKSQGPRHQRETEFQGMALWVTPIKTDCGSKWSNGILGPGRVASPFYSDVSILAHAPRPKSNYSKEATNVISSNLKDEHSWPVWTPSRAVCRRCSQCGHLSDARKKWRVILYFFFLPLTAQAPRRLWNHYSPCQIQLAVDFAAAPHQEWTARKLMQKRTKMKTSFR